jgi:two-component system catabolic regulation response regulator CreB
MHRGTPAFRHPFHSDVPNIILIVDDEPSIVATLEYALRTEGFETRCAGLGQQALQAAQAGDVALVILDVGLPDMSGFDVCRELRRASELPVLFLTARADEVDRIVGLELGADDYVPKPFSPREVASRVRAILRRCQASSRPATPAPSFRVDTEGARIAWGDTWLPLTRYEYGLLASLLERPGRILSRARLMETVWHDAEDSFDRTVDAHVKTLRAKLRAACGDDPIETHRGMGYSIRADLA